MKIVTCRNFVLYVAPTAVQWPVCIVPQALQSSFGAILCYWSLLAVYTKTGYKFHWILFIYGWDITFHIPKPLKHSSNFNMHNYCIRADITRISLVDGISPFCCTCANNIQLFHEKTMAEKRDRHPPEFYHALHNCSTATSLVLVRRIASANIASCEWTIIASFRKGATKLSVLWGRGESTKLCTQVVTFWIGDYKSMSAWLSKSLPLLPT